VDAQKKTVLSVEQSAGSIHDFQLFKDTYRGIDPQIQLLADSGYQGISAFHANSRIPFKRSRDNPLTPEQKTYNRNLSRERIVIEHINRRIKRFKILSDRYRNKRKKHTLRVSLVCAIHNFEQNSANHA
jgi:IS5 family transposase